MKNDIKILVIFSVVAFILAAVSAFTGERILGLWAVAYPAGSFNVAFLALATCECSVLRLFGGVAGSHVNNDYSSGLGNIVKASVGLAIVLAAIITISGVRILGLAARAWSVGSINLLFLAMVLCNCHKTGSRS